MWINLGKAMVTALVVIIAAEWLAHGVMGRVEFAHSYDVSRNPNYRRAWPAYTEPRPRAANEKLVIVISNSQGFAHELEDADQCYPHLLEEELNRQDAGSQYKVVNWSLGGVSGPEMLLLAARAVDHNPDAVLLVTHSNPFSHKRLSEPLSFYLSDTGQLAYTQPVRDRLPGWFLRQHEVYDPATFLETRSGLVKSRNTFIEQRHRRWLIASADDEPRRGPIKRFNAPEVRNSGDKLLKACIDIIQESHPDTPILLVNMPLCESKWTEQAWERLQSFGQTMQDIAEQSPRVTAINASEAVAQDQFITHTHMSAPGHVRFADYLLPHVNSLLESSAVSTATHPDSPTP